MIKKFFSWIGDSLLNLLDDEPYIETKMKTSKQGIELIKEFEGFRAKPYYCSANVVTIGYGSTTYTDGRKVQITDKAISKDEAEKMLKEQLTKIYEPIIHQWVKVPLSQNQFDALVSFIYNVGETQFSRSTLLRKLNEGFNKNIVADELLKWVYAGGEVSEGLKNRRNKERELFLR